MRPIDIDEGGMRELFGLALMVVALAGGACSGSAGSPSPTAPPTPGPTASGPMPVIEGTVTAGPICPVESNPPDPACAPRPVAGAVIVATNEDGDEVGRATSGDDGAYELAPGQTGTLLVTGLPVEGLMGVPKPVSVVLDKADGNVVVDLVYDTGIR